MNIEEIQRLFMDLNIGLAELLSYHPDSYSDQVVLGSIINKVGKANRYINQLEADNLEMAKAIVEESEIRGEGITPKMYHNAVKYIKEVEK